MLRAMAGDSYLRLPKIFPASQGHGLLRKSAQLIEKIWRPRRDLNPCYRRESGMAKRNSNKLQERERTGCRSRSSKKHLIVSPMCPRIFDASTSLSILFQELSNVFSHLLVSEAIADCMRLRLREGE